MDRIGAGFIAILAALFFAMFDITASLLVLLGFLIFRWAVIAAPILGTIGLLRPASAGIRRLANAVVAAIFNIVIFGTGAAIYLFAVDLIMNTADPPGLAAGGAGLACGVVGWLLLRPYRRITQLGGKDSSGRSARPAPGTAGSSVTCATRPGSTSPSRGGTAEPTIGTPARTVLAEPARLRPEARHEDPSHAATPAGRPAAGPDGWSRCRSGGGPARAPAATGPRPAETTWTEPDVPDQTRYAVYRPDSAKTAPRAAHPPRRAPRRGEPCDGRSATPHPAAPLPAGVWRW